MLGQFSLHRCDLERRLVVELEVYWSSAGGKIRRATRLPWSDPAVSDLRPQIQITERLVSSASGISDSSLSFRRRRGHFRSTVNRLSCLPVIRCFNQESSSLNCSSNEV